jgi:hypothetical protein
MERVAASGYIGLMDDEVPQTEPPRSWIEALDRADADIAAGRVVDGALIHKMLEDALDRLGRRNTPKKPRAASGR